MSGHSKWSSIKHKKAAADAKRGQAVHQAGARDHRRRARRRRRPDANPSLATAIQKARDASMPKDNIQRAIDRGTGASADGAAIEQIVFEGYGPGGAAILVEALTDNRNRTSADVRLAFTKHGGSLGEPGSVAWIFEKRGAIVVDGDRYGEDDLIAAIDAGAEDVREDGDLAAGALRAERPERRARGAGGGRGGDRVGRAGDGAKEHGRGRQRPTPAGCSACSTTLEEHDDVNEVHAQLRHPRRGIGAGRGLSSSCAARAECARRQARHPPDPRPRPGRGAGEASELVPESLPMQVVMGIDPGAANLGFGIVAGRGQPHGGA